MAGVTKLIGALAKASKEAELASAAERAAAGRRAADVHRATAPMKMSEALGNMNLEGKGALKVTQSDRTRVGGGNIGGAMFPGLQQVSPFYEGAVWGVGNKPTASGLINQSDVNTLWTTLLGSADQLKTNPIVFNKLRRGFTDAMKEGKLSDELAGKINQNLAIKFGEGADIRDPGIWRKADTFDKRSLLADVMMGQGVAPGKGGVALGGEKSGKGVIFQPSEILKRETEPLLLHPEHGGDVPTFAVGPRLFSLSGDVKQRPDLHPGFPFILQGEDKGVVFRPEPGEVVMRDYAQRFKEKNKRSPGYYDWTLGEKGVGLPTQPITEEYLTYLQKLGKKDGGDVNKGDYQQRLDSMISDHMNGKAAFGVFPQMKPRRSKQDREAAKNFPVDVARGALSGVLGAPGDIESLVRLIPGLERDRNLSGLVTGQHRKTYLPTSEEIEKRIPFKSDTPVSKAATGLGQLAGGFYTGPGAPIRAVGALPGAIKHGATEFAKASAAGAPRVVKQKGGNWVGGALDSLINDLAYGKFNADPDAMKHYERMKNMYSPESIDAMNPNLQQTTRQHLKDSRNSIALGEWANKNLTNYIKKEMGTPEDPVRKLAEQGITHLKGNMNPNVWTLVSDAREAAGFPRGGLGQSNLAKGWEALSDSAIESFPVEMSIKSNAAEPWMHKVPPETPVHNLAWKDTYNGTWGQALGFDHIIDVLKQDLAEGRIRPEQLSKVSMEQAVRRTHEYDQEMAKKMREAQIKQTEGMPVHKEYPEGYKWIELAPPKELPAGYSVVKDEITGSYKVVDASGKNVVKRQANELGHINVPFNKTEEEAIADALKHDKRLEDALKYEGDTMGHCVGGYCPDVVSGKSRIFSLRDEKNEPHVTVEVQKPQNKETLSPVDYFLSHYSSEPFRQRVLKDPEMAQMIDTGDIRNDRFNEFVKNTPEYASYVDSRKVNERITQIKGKGNAKPKKQYIPYVQDFVKSGNWSDVDDLQNAEMHYSGNLYTNNERKNLERLTGENLEYVAHQDIPKHRELLKQHNVPPLMPDEKADGGEVDAETVFMAKGGSTIKNVEDYLRQREGEYGVKRLQRAADEIPHLERMYTEDALRRAFGGDNAKALMTMNPADFERFAVRLFPDPDTREDEMNERFEYVRGLPPMTHPEYIRYLARIKGGFNDVPFLEIGNKFPEYLPNITGHEGRHRTRALAKKKVQKSLVQLYPTASMREGMPRRYREDFIEAMKKELGEKRLVTGEGRSLLPRDLEAPEHKRIERLNLLGGRPQLPEIYKDGGEVDAESCFFPKSKE